MHMMNAPGEALVKTMPDDVVNWIAETAIIWAQKEGVRDDDTEWFFVEPEECPEPEVVEVIVEREVFVEAECEPCQEQTCDPCPIVDCPVPEACPFPICEECVCEECLCDEYCEAQLSAIPLGDAEDEDDDEYYSDAEIDEEHLCDPTIENCRTSKGNRNTDTYDENYNAYYYYGSYYDYGYFTNYDYDYDYTYNYYFDYYYYDSY